jgi:hypothetical protein
MYCVVREVRVPAIPYTSPEMPVFKAVEFPEDAVITEIRIEPHLYPLETLRLVVSVVDQDGTTYYEGYVFSSKDAKLEKVLSARDLYSIFGNREKPLHIRKIEFSATSNMERTPGYFVIWIMYWTSKPEHFYQLV